MQACKDCLIDIQLGILLRCSRAHSIPEKFAWDLHPHRSAYCITHLQILTCRLQQEKRIDQSGEVDLDKFLLASAMAID